MSKYYYNLYEEDGVDVVKLGVKDDDTDFVVKIAPKEGNNLFGLCVNGNEIIYHDKSSKLSSFTTGSPILFPFPNRIEDAMWEWEEKSYIHKKHGVPRQLHSLLFDEREWEYDMPKIYESCVVFNTRLEVNKNHPIYRGYPFTFLLHITYTLKKNGLTITYELFNKGNRAMPYGFGLHPYFNRLSGNDKTKIKMPCKYFYDTREDVDEKYLTYNGMEFEMTPNILPTGKLLESIGSKADLLDYKSVGDLDLDHVFTDRKSNPPAIIDYEDQRTRLIISQSQEFTHYVIYTPEDKDFFALEPQTCSTDAINLYARGNTDCNLLILGPNEKSEGKINFLFETY